MIRPLRRFVTRVSSFTIRGRAGRSSFVGVWIAPALAVAAFAFAGHFAPAAAVADDSFDLRPVWEEGQQARYRLTQTQTTRAEMHGIDEAEPQQSVTEFEGELTWRVIDAHADGGGTAELTIDQLQITVTGPDGESRSASDQHADEAMEPLRDWLNAMVGRSLTYQVDSDGEIASVRGFDAIQRRAGEMGEGMDERYFRNLGRDLAAVVGGTADAGIGTSWTSTQQSSHQFGEVTSNATYEVVGFDQPAGVPTVTIERTASLDLVPELPDLPPDGPEVDFEVREGQSSGVILFDLSRHEVVGYFNTQTLAAEVSFTLPDRRMTQVMHETTETRALRIAED